MLQDQEQLPIEPGTKLGPYVVQEAIGRGAMGVVYRAYHAELERTGAVKVLQAIGADPESKARFRREALAIAHMRHPNILNVFDFGEIRGTPYMIVEFVAGGSLANRLQAGPLDQQSALAFLRGIGEGLDYAHSLGIVHRDVKPANVLLGPEDTPILADFGLVKLMESNSVNSMTGVTTGTPAYMAPEQVTATDVGPAADRYSLATIAYELLTGGYPFDGEGVLEMLYAHVHREPPPPSSRNPKLGPAVDSVILRGLAKDPGERWPTCEEFVAALDTALKAGPAAISAGEKTISLARLAPAVAATLPVRPRANATPKVAVAPAADGKRSLRSPYLVGAILLIPLLLVGGYCGFNATRQSTTRPPTTARAADPVVPGPTPAASPSPNPTAGTNQPPGAVSNAGPSPLPQPSTAPNPQPSPSPAPPPPPPPAPSISLSSNHIAMLTGSVTVYGLNFGAGKAVTISFIQGATNQQTKTTAASDGRFTKLISIPATAVPGQATITACDSTNACASQPITVTAT